MRHQEVVPQQGVALGRILSAASILAMLVVVAACPGLSDPAEPNTSLTGTNPNASATFEGVITLGGGGAAVPADGATDALLSVLVVNAAGQPVANGVAVNFSTSLGTIRAADGDPATAGRSTTVTTFEGRASVAVRSTAVGLAEVQAWIANVSSLAGVTFERVPLSGTLDLAFRTDGGDVANIVTTAATNALLVGTAKDDAGNTLSGMVVRFRIVRDTTAPSGQGIATFGGVPKALTNSTGEAYNTLFVTGVGEVVVAAKLLDPNTDELIAESGPITLVTTEIAATTSVTLEFEDGGTTSSGLAGAAAGLVATVFSEQTGAFLPGLPVRFRIISDSSDILIADPAELANSSSSMTNTDGEATNAIIGYDSGAVIVIEVEVSDAGNGGLLARSNQVVYTVQ